MKKLTLIIATFALTLSVFAGNNHKTVKSVSIQKEVTADIQKDGKTLLLITNNFWLANSLQNEHGILGYSKEANQQGEMQYYLYFANEDGGITENFILGKIKLYTGKEQLAAR